MQRLSILLASTLVLLPACPGGGDTLDGGVHDAGVVLDGGGTSDGGGSADGGGSDGGGSGDGGEPIAEWQDTPGSCPAGQPRVELSTAAELAAAARGESPFDGDLPETCYLLRDGIYADSSNVLMWIRQGGAPGAPRIFVGESRAGVVIQARATVEADHLRIENLTFDIGPYVKSGSFNTMTVGTARDVTVSHVTFTGDCATGSSGGHFEVDDGEGIVLESSLVEYFGQCGPAGHLDHGVYLAAGRDITIRNNLIRGNASRGVQLNTQGGAFGTLEQVLIERNRITANGHANYEDGIVVNATSTGTVTDLTVRRNLIHGNYYSGLRFSGAALLNVLVEYNTFFENGVGSSAGGRSEVNLDDVGSGASTTLRGNLFVPGHQVLNDCYDAGPRGFAFTDNASTLPQSAGCLGNLVSVSPTFVDSANGDFHLATAEAGTYGAYAP